MLHSCENRHLKAKSSIKPPQVFPQIQSARSRSIPHCPSKPERGFIPTQAMENPCFKWYYCCSFPRKLS